MKSTFTFVAAATLLFTFVSCKKSGKFSTDKDTYKQGETIYTKNETEKPSTYYLWTFGSDELVGEEPVYTIPESTPVGNFEIKMVPANSTNTIDNWKSTSQSVMIEEAEEAKVIFYIRDPLTGGSDERCIVVLENESKTIYPSNAFPACDKNNLDAATFDNLPAGDYTFSFTASSSRGRRSSSGSIELNDGFDCEIIDLSKF